MADPADLRAELRRGAIAIAPLRAGSGTPIKILEAMAEGVPVVATPAALAGLDGLPPAPPPGPKAPPTSATPSSRLLADPAAADTQRRIAYEWVKERHDRRAGRRPRSNRYCLDWERGRLARPDLESGRDAPLPAESARAGRPGRPRGAQ